MVATKRNATYADLLALPDHVMGQIVEGVLHATPRPAIPHGVTATAMAMDIGSPFQRGRGGPGGWWIVFEPELHLGTDVVVPDLAGWRVERMPRPPSTATVELAPDWLCEVLSPSTQLLDRGPKLRLYGRVGVVPVWFVDPVAHTLEILRFRDSAWTVISVHGGNERVRAEPFDAIELDLSGWWAAEEPPAV
jgi:Uma2 family endonuclease